MASFNKKKILKNTTNAPIELSQIGLTVPALGQIVIEPGIYYILANEIGLSPAGQLDTLIASQSIVVNDGVDDLIPPSISYDRAIDYLKHPDRAFNIRFEAEPERLNGFASKNVQEAIEEARSAIEGKISVLPTFLNNGITKNKWLSLDGSMNASNILPAVASYDSRLAGMTFINGSNNANTDIEFYNNGSLIYTWEVRNSRYAYKTDLPLMLLNRGDRLSCFCKDFATGTDPSSVIVNVFVQSVNSLTGEGSGPTLA